MFLCPITRKDSIVILDCKVVLDIVLVSYYITFKKTTKTEHGHTITRKSFTSFKNELFSIIFILKNMWHSHLSFLFYILTIDMCLLILLQMKLCFCKMFHNAYVIIKVKKTCNKFLLKLYTATHLSILLAFVKRIPNHLCWLNKAVP